MPCFNVINGGAHAPNALDPQEFMLCAARCAVFREALRAGAEIYASLRGALDAAGMRTGWATKVASRRALDAAKKP